MTPQQAVNELRRIIGQESEDSSKGPPVPVEVLNALLAQVQPEQPHYRQAPRALHAALDTLYSGVLISEVGNVDGAPAFAVSCPTPVVQAAIDHLAQIPPDVLMASRAAPQYLAQAVVYIEQRMQAGG